MNSPVRKTPASLASCRSGWLLLAAITTVLAVTTKAQAQSVSTHHVRDVVRDGVAQPLGRLPGTQVMSLDIVLPLRDSQGLETFLADVYNPASSSYRHFLTVAEFTERFGPSQADYDA